MRVNPGTRVRRSCLMLLDFHLLANMLYFTLLVLKGLVFTTGNTFSFLSRGRNRNWTLSPFVFFFARLPRGNSARCPRKAQADTRVMSLGHLLNHGKEASRRSAQGIVAAEGACNLGAFSFFPPPPNKSLRTDTVRYRKGKGV